MEGDPHNQQPPARGGDRAVVVGMVVVGMVVVKVVLLMGW
jgi:hypothetical protein